MRAEDPTPCPEATAAPEASGSPPPFVGIDQPNTTPVPDIYFDLFFPTLAKGPLKVLLYLTRRVFGFRKTSGDTISLRQICTGIRGRDGAVHDLGTGLSRPAACEAVRSLEALGLITATRARAAAGDAAVTHYALRFRAPVTAESLVGRRPDGERPFAGIDSPNTTPVPDTYFDRLLPVLGLAEWRLLLFVCRRTLGFKKLSDAISLDQFSHGITSDAGLVLSVGAGLDRSSVTRSARGLVAKGVLLRQAVSHPSTGDGISVYSLAIGAGARERMGQVLGLASGPGRGLHELPTPGLHDFTTSGLHELPTLGGAGFTHPGGCPILPPLAGPAPEAGGTADRSGGGGIYLPGLQDLPTGVAGSYLPVGKSRHPQQTDKQETPRQEDERSRATRMDLKVREIAADLAVPVGEYARRTAALARIAGPPDAFEEALAQAWEITRDRLAEGALARPGAALAYWFSVLKGLVSGAGRLAIPSRSTALPGGPIRRGVGSTAPAPGRRSWQDRGFVETAAIRLGALPPQAPWEAILGWLGQTLTPGNMERWFIRSVLVEAVDRLVVAVADPTQRDWLNHRLGERIHEVLREGGEPRPVRFVLVEECDLVRAG
ncbi:MAG TPA: hypothetical protein VNL71_09570 [Chloroflexota bacterium]|nr:hypothetical protein [Chloroflexota bacterium]